MENPEWEPLEGESLHTRRLVPVYPGTEGLPQRLVRRLSPRAGGGGGGGGGGGRGGGGGEALPGGVRRRLKAPPLPRAMRGMHVPASPREAREARRRFALGGLLYIELGVVRRRGGD